MTSLIDQLAELTGHRDRQQADALVLDTMRELLQPATLALHRCVGEVPEQHWLTTARQGGAGNLELAAGLRLSALQQLPVLESRPDWLECLRSLHPLERPGVTLLPLVVGAQAVGVVELRWAQAPQPQDRRTAEALMRLYGNFLALLDFGERDALTGVFNRKSFNDSFMRAVLQGATAQRREAVGAGAEAEPAPAPPCYFLAVLDLDHFRQINSTFGYLIGDEMLLLTARVLRAFLRLDNSLYRFAGEQFLVLLEAADEDEAQATLDRMRQRLAQHAFPQVGHVTASIGFTAVLPSDLPTCAIERADRALHLAKASGRNRVIGPAAMAAAGLGDEPSHGGDVDLF